MKLLTQQFIKDFFWSVVFILGMYLIINNPVTHPTPKPTPGYWSIQLMQHPLVFGLAGHNYLVLRDNNQNITKELHGLPTNKTTGTWKYIGTNSADILQVWSFNGPRDYIAEKKFSGVVLTEGNKEEIIEIWQKGEICKDSINNKKINYPPFGVKLNTDTENSNSVAYTLALCMGLDTKHIGLITPGSNKNLLEN